MKVKYVGKSDSLTCDYNGKRYCFSKRQPIIEIPDEVYAHILKSGHFNSGDVVPFQGNQEATASTDPQLEKDLASLQADHEELKGAFDDLKKEHGEAIDKIKELEKAKAKLDDEVEKLEKKLEKAKK